VRRRRPQATSFALPDKLTEQEKTWQQYVQPRLQQDLQKVPQLRRQRHEPATLVWARKITAADVAVLDGKKPYNREAPKEDVDKLKLLKGHFKRGRFVPKLRKVFRKDEMTEDLVFTRARVGDKDDDLEYVSILSTSPP
jgi:hypothetical protein